ncbi:hypothetical protein GJ744_000841 [Endocarpon pusillum]|uniref:RING-type domain-containing protein n=1 Tax=Endocarpon pusillum TaxID=364733 RepID=A0A8H7ANN8_9EURO|nr:hypothetical protein GJ744_000841 [Endocarpon pusillum]
MTAIFWDALTVVLPQPVQVYAQGADLVPSNISFRVEGNSTISTLSDRGAQISSESIVQGLFYVPNLNASDPCADLSSQFLPQNVTRRANIPGVERYALVAVAPWVSDHPECAVAYMRATQADSSAGLFFFPTRPNAAFAAPVWDNWGVNASTWNDWVLGAEFPIWGIPPDSGATLVQELGKYSGNVSDAPFSSELAQVHPPTDAARLLARVALNSSRDSNPVLGRLWVFAILVLAILCVVTGLTSLIMHINQRRLRRDLRRRIGNGQVDLEILGIKRQKVPQKVLDKMPLYVYTSKLTPTTSPTKDTTPTSTRGSSLTQRKNLPNRDVPFSQTTCPICLDDFEHDETVVRELPCQHIFHPECVDEFLRTNSSLCPMCKKSALPTGYCPENITTSMVRRERALRRMRELGTDSPPISSMLPASVQRFLPGWLLRAQLRPRQGAERRDRQGHRPNRLTRPGRPQRGTPTIDTPLPTPPGPAHTTDTAASPTPAAGVGADLEMGTLTSNSNPTRSSDPLPLPTLEDLPPEIQALPPEERREWGRQRLAATLPPTAEPAVEEIPATSMGRLKRGWKRLFPS